MSKFPFNRLLGQDFFYSDLGNLTISGKLITEYFKNGIAEDGHLIFEHDTVEANPHIFKEDFLIRGTLETVNEEAFVYLLSAGKASPKDYPMAEQQDHNNMRWWPH